MLRTLASAIFLIDSLVIGLGAFGHGLQARHVHEILDPFPIEPDLRSMIIGVLYVGIGAFGLVYRNGDPFMGFFVILGALLLASGYILVRSAARAPRVSA